MDTILIKNLSASPRIIAWTERRPPLPSLLNPAHWDRVRGHHGDHTITHSVPIPVGEVRQLPAEVVADLRANDRIVRAWFECGDLAEVAESI